MALSASGELHAKFQRMVDQLDGIFDPGVELYDSDPAFNVSTYVLRVRTRSETRQAMSIITGSGIMLAEAIYAMSRLYAKTKSSLFEWDDLAIKGNSLIEVSIESEEGDEGLYYAIYINKTF